MIVVFVTGMTIKSEGNERSFLYLDYSSLTQTIQTMEREHPDYVRVTSLAKSRENRDVWMVELGKGSPEERMKRPGFLLAAGLEGDRILESDTAVQFLRYACENIQSETITEILQTATLYIIPRLNPDAMECFFTSPSIERTVNLTPFDDDRDGTCDEDPPDDLNGDGAIAWMRVEDPKGMFIAHPQEERVTIEADPAKKEVGRWLYLPEGIDDDRDNAWNEDGVGGVQLNSNFVFAYPWFDPTAGLYPLSENETRALAEWMVAHPHIGLICCFESRGNLLKTPETSEAAKDREPQTITVKEDGKLIEELGKEYRQVIGLKQEIETKYIPGSFSEWMYFHRGRLALSTPLWNPELAVALYPLAEESNEVSDASPTEKAGTDATLDNGSSKEKGDIKDDRAKAERDYLRWIDRHAPAAFLAWTTLNHPDFPRQRTEIGGWKPYALTVPPERYRAEVETKNIHYLVSLIKQLPRVAIHQTKVKRLGPELYELKVLVRNNGMLPTVLTHGKRTNEVRPTRIELDLAQEMILSGSTRTILEPLQAGETVEVPYTLLTKADKPIHILVVSECAGQDERTVKLREE